MPQCVLSTRAPLQLPSHGLCYDKDKQSVPLLSCGTHKTWKVLACPPLCPWQQAWLLQGGEKYVLNGKVMVKEVPCSRGTIQLLEEGKGPDPRSWFEPLTLHLPLSFHFLFIEGAGWRKE